MITQKSTKHRAALRTAGLLACLSFLTPALAAPKPSIVPQAWELECRTQPPERLILTINGQPRTFWFIRYNMVNRTGADQLFVPDFELLTDSGQLLKSGQGVPREVFGQIKALYSNSFLEDPLLIYGKILQGDDNSKEGVAIFSGLDEGVHQLRFLIRGLSGETTQVTSPASGKTVSLYKTLVLDYRLAGQAIGIPPVAEGGYRTWVMR